MKRFIALISLTTLLLAGCDSNSDQKSAQSQKTEIAQETEVTEVTQITPKTLNTTTERKMINALIEMKIDSPILDRMTDPQLGKWTENGKNNYVFENTKEQRASLFVYRINDFKRSGEGLFDFTIPQALKDEFYTSDNPCALFKNWKSTAKTLSSPEPYLPLDVVESPVLCKSTNMAGAAKVISLIGVESQFEGLSRIGNMMLVVRGNDVVIFSNLVPASVTAKFDREYDKFIDDYIKSHPDVEFPNDSFKKLSEVVDGNLVKAIQMPEPELKNALDHLNTIAESL